jgi:AAA domain
LNAYDIVAGLGGRFNAASGKGTARCPVHGDRTPSLSVAEKDGIVLVHCHAGCEQEDVLAALRERGLWPELPRFEPAPRLQVPKMNGTSALKAEVGVPTRIAAQYDYTDEQGNLLFQALRLEPKQFRQRRPDGNGGWLYSLDGTRRVLYRLPLLVQADPKRIVFVVEGEKDVDRLASIGLLATTNPMGAGKWLPEYAQALRGRHVVVIPDNDKVGREHADSVIASVLPVAASVRRLELPGLPDKGDVSDWLDDGHDRRDLEALVLATEPLARPARPFLNLQELLEEAQEQEVEVVPGLVWAGRSHWTYSGPGVGKTLFKVALGMHVAAGRAFCGRPVRQGPVLLIEEDSPKAVIADYVRLLAQLYKFELSSLPFYVNRLQGYRAASEEGTQKIRELIASLPEPPVYVILDACERIVPSDKFNSKELEPLDSLIRDLTGQGIAVDVIDHTRKSQPEENKTDPVDLLYGGRAKSAISDIMLFMSGEVKDGTLCTFTKFRGEKPPPVLVRFDPDDDGFSLKQQRRRFSATEQVIMRMVNDQPGGEVARATLVEKSGKSEDSIDRAAARLERDLLILIRRDRETFYRQNPGAAGLFQ